jgi:protein SCO1/2
VTHRLLWAIAVMTAATVLGLVVSWSPPRTTPGVEQARESDRPLLQDTLARVPPFVLVERSGKEMTLGDLSGKVWIADFIWTRCPDVCPLISAVMARIQAHFKDEPDLRLVSISVDPEHDTPPVLSRYAAQFGADPDRWLFLTGDKKSIHTLVREGFKLLVYDPAEAPVSSEPAHAPDRRAALRLLRGWVDPAMAWAHAGSDRREQPVIHSDRFVLVDRAGSIQGYYRATDPQALEQLMQDAQKVLDAAKRV